MKIMAHSIKCPNCMTWNNGTDYCVKCNALLNSEMLREMEYQQKQQVIANRPPDSTEIFISKLKNSNNWLVKIIYLIFHSIWFVFFSIISFLMVLVALAPG